MFNQLPQEVQNEIKRHLMANNYVLAKMLYDAWVASQMDAVA